MQILWRKNNQGFSSIGMAIALLLTLSLVFSGVQIYRINSQSASIQEVADVCAIAAENQVAEYLTVQRVCDAALLSMALTGTICGILGAAAVCTPVTAGYSAELIQTSKNIFNARDTFAQNAATGLNAWQEILPFLAAAQAYNCAQANNTNNSTYIALAILNPLTCETITFDTSTPTATLDDISDSAESLSEDLRNAENSTGTAEEAKHEAWLHDCGIAATTGGYCMYERATSLARLRGMQNPMISNEKLWNFQKAITRSRAYYNARKIQETPADATLQEQAKSALRYSYYSYAYSEMLKAYATESGGSFDCYFPLLPKNIEELKQTNLYTQKDFPITCTSGQYCMHATADCPGAADYVRLGSAKEMDDLGMSTCPYCHFNTEALASVGAASCIISNGYEYHYRIVAECAQNYKAALSGESPEIENSKSTVLAWIQSLIEYLQNTLNKRIDADPPGSDGTIVLVINTSTPVSSYTSSNFLEYTGSVGTRIAVAGSVLAEETATEQNSVVADLLKGLSKDNSGSTYVGNIILSLWNNLLYYYAQGQSGLENAAKNAFDGFSWQSPIGLGDWMSEKFSEFIESIGLQAANINTPKAILTNTANVASASDTSLAMHYLSIRNISLAFAGNTESINSLLNEQEQRILESLGFEDGTLEIATIYPLGGSWPAIPITISLPATSNSTGVKNALADAIETFLSTIRSYQNDEGERTIWN